MWIPVMPAIRTQPLENCKFGAILGNIRRPCLKIKQTKNELVSGTGSGGACHSLCPSLCVLQMAVGLLAYQTHTLQLSDISDVPLVYWKPTLLVPQYFLETVSMNSHNNPRGRNCFISPILQTWKPKIRDVSCYSQGHLCVTDSRSEDLALGLQASNPGACKSRPRFGWRKRRHL